jgi:hypothetical protein
MGLFKWFTPISVPSGGAIYDKAGLPDLPADGLKGTLEAIAKGWPKEMTGDEDEILVPLDADVKWVSVPVRGVHQQYALVAQYRRPLVRRWRTPQALIVLYRAGAAPTRNLTPVKDAEGALQRWDWNEQLADSSRYDQVEVPWLNKSGRLLSKGLLGRLRRYFVDAAKRDASVR